jgi:hypothetical protein
MIKIGQQSQNINPGISGSHMLSVGGRNINVLILISGVASGDVIVNEDGSGDAILFENNDNWVVE